METLELLGWLRAEEQRLVRLRNGPEEKRDALTCIRGALAAERQHGAVVQQAKMVIKEVHLQIVFVALCRRYGVQPFRKKGQRRTTFMVEGPDVFLTELFHPLVGAYLTRVGDAITGFVDGLATKLEADE